MCVFPTLNSIISFQVISCHSSHGLYAEMTLKISSHQNISAQNEIFWWLISHWAKSVNNPFPPTIFYDTLTAIILTFYSTFHNKKWYFRLGVSSQIKMWFARKAKQNWKYLQKLQPGLVQGGQGTRISVLGSWWIILHRYKNLSNFPEKEVHVIFFWSLLP